MGCSSIASLYDVAEHPAAVQGPECLGVTARKGNLPGGSEECVGVGKLNPALNRSDSEVREMPLILSVGNYTSGKILGKGSAWGRRNVWLSVP